MKKGIHPDYKLTTIRCACGAEYKVSSTRENQRLEICGSCHPFYTGRQKLVDTAGRVEKFNKRYSQFSKPAPAAAEAVPAATAPAAE